MSSVRRTSVRIIWLVLAIAGLGLMLTGCGQGTERVHLGFAEGRAGSAVLGSGCWKTLDTDAELANDQIVVTEMTASGEIDGDCLSTVETDLATGPDVVHPDAAARWALVGDEHRQVEYCGLDTPRCIEFSSDQVAASCAEESLRFTTVGMYDGVYPFEVRRCDRGWALIDLDTCDGYHGENGPHCQGTGVQRILIAIADGRWYDTGFDQDGFCPNPSESYGADVPGWVCDIE